MATPKQIDLLVLLARKTDIPTVWCMRHFDIDQHQVGQKHLKEFYEFFRAHWATKTTAEASAKIRELNDASSWDPHTAPATEKALIYLGDLQKRVYGKVTPKNWELSASEVNDKIKYLRTQPTLKERREGDRPTYLWAVS